MNSLAGSIPARPQTLPLNNMTILSTQNTNKARYQQQPTDKKALKNNTFSPSAEFALIAAFASLALFTVVVALAHTLSFLVSTLGAPLFTLLTPAAAVIFASLVPVLANPVHALLCLLGLFAATALIYLSLGAEYLGLVFSLVYLGAVAILFLYVIMLLNVKDIMSAQQSARSRGYRYFFSGLVGYLLLARLPVMVQDGLQSALLFPTEKSQAYRSAFDELASRMETDILSLRNLYGES